MTDMPTLTLKLFCAVVLCLLPCAAAEPVFANLTDETSPTTVFSIDSAQRLEIQSMLDSLTAAPDIETVIANRARISKYISVNRQKAAQIEKEVHQLETALSGVVEQNQDQKLTANSAISNLIALKQQKEQELVELRLLTMTGEEAVAQLNNYIRDRETQDIYFRGEPLWRFMAGSGKASDPHELHRGPASAENRLVILFTAFFSGLFLFFSAVVPINRFIAAHGGKGNLVFILVNLISHSPRFGRSILLVFSGLGAFVAVSLFVFHQWPMPAMAIQIVFFYLILRLVLHGLVMRFHSLQPSGPDPSVHRAPGWALYPFSLLSGFLIAAMLGFDSGFVYGDLSMIFRFLFFSCWLLLLFLFCRQAVTVIRPGIWKYCRPMLLVALLVLIFLEILGYRNLNEHLAAMLGRSFIIFSISVILYDSVDLLTALLERVTAAILQRFSLKPVSVGPGGETGGVQQFIRVGLKIYIVIGALALIIQRWSMGSDDDERLMSYFISGWNIGGFSISPARLSLGILLFSLAWPAVGYLKQLIDRHWLANTEMSSSSRDTVLTLAGYGGFAAVITLSLGIAGLRLTGLTVIIGALSVGIGFGLQNIVNNFISGLILMFERPIKKGDWIQVGTTEGYVKKISIRSTIVQTFDRSDVIVPNSELISSQVINMMLDDQRGRLRISVGVAYGSDTELVQRLLLEAAHAHDQVITDGSTPEPRAIFQAFGESSLDFDLLVHLKDIDLKLRVRSEIHTMIDKAFRKHGIEIPFPQRDVHLKNGAPSSQ
jgi:potassium efflux system protein